ncbi:MAG: hypothetical protein D6718_10890 [Acidobacteria bacterium]|nr:MAG: hypothetical protein D6718_10890 [Acidobacteriota bacterium]
MSGRDLERELERYFAAERAAVRAQAPPFSRVWGEARRAAAGRKTWRVAAALGALAAAAAGLAILVTGTRPPIEEEVVQRARRLSEWEAPTDEIWNLGNLASLPGVPDLNLSTLTFEQTAPEPSASDGDA